jgi:hypothetical protein
MMEDRLLVFTGPSPRGWHRIQTFLECPQRYAYEYEGRSGHGAAAKEDSEDAVPLVRGSLLHLGLAQHYSQMREYQTGGNPDRYYDPVEAIQILAEAKGGVWASEAPEIIRCVDAYREYWHAEDFKVLHVEELFQGNFHGYPFTGRLDLVVEDRQGNVWVIDHKGTSFLSDKQRQFYSMSGQVHAYRWLAASVYGDRLAGVRINLVQHTKTFKFQRVDCDPAPHLFQRFPSIVQHAEQEIARLQALNLAVNEWPMAATELTCFHRYGKCKFAERCKWGS